MEVNGQLNAPATLSLSPQLSLDKKLVGPQGQSRRTGKNKYSTPVGNRNPVAQPLAKPL
jgi:hypothetical protein